MGEARKTEIITINALFHHSPYPVVPVRPFFLLAQKEEEGLWVWEQDNSFLYYHALFLPETELGQAEYRLDLVLNLDFLDHLP